MQNCERPRALWLMVAILLIAAALRLVALGDVPPGLYHDEAYNGLDALKVLDGDLPLYFAANNGREPMFIYLIAAAVGVLGRSPFAVRLAAVAPGLLTIAATYALGRTLFDRRVGLLAAAILSITLWHVHLSRVGFRAVLLPLFTALYLWQGALAIRTGRRRYWLAAGLLYGLSFYTYMAARFTPVALLLFAIPIILIPNTQHLHRAADAVQVYPISTYVSRFRWAILGLILTIAPLALFTLRHPDLVLARTGQVAIWEPVINGGDFWGTLFKHTLRTLGMFFVRGDRIWRHNLPWRPVFDPLMGFLFILGLWWTLRRFRRDGAAALLLIWTAAMALPTLLAEDAPHFLRGVGVLPVAAFFPALGLRWVLDMGYRVWVSRRSPIPNSPSPILLLLPLAVLTISFISTTRAYFGSYARADMAAYWFEDGAVELAGRVNAFLGSGWDGERMLQGEPGERVAYIEPLLWDEWEAVPFLVADSPAVRLLPLNRAWPAVDDGPAAIFVWPYGNWRRVWPMLNAPAEIRVESGALSQGDRDPEPFVTYLAFYVTPVEAAPLPLARFSGGVELVSAGVQATSEGVRVELVWHVTARLPDDYTVFVHYLRAGERVGQHDGPPTDARYPTTRWRAGDLVHDVHLIPVEVAPDPSQDALRIGLYRAADGLHLDLLDAAGNPAGTFATLPLSELP